MTTKKTRARQGGRLAFLLTAKEWPEAIEIIRTMSGEKFVEPPDRGEHTTCLFDYLVKGSQMIPGASYFAALAKCGTWFRGYMTPGDYPKALRKWVAVRKPLPQQCYYNSTMAALVGPAEDLGLSYFEGQVILPDVPVPIEHAWLGTLAGGVAVDLTLPTVERRTERTAEIRAGAVYCGVKIPPGLLNRLTCDDEMTGPRLPEWLTAAVDYVRGLE